MIANILHSFIILCIYLFFQLISFRSILGISVHYEYNGRIVARLVGAKRLLSTHTGGTITKILMETLKSFCVRVDDVYTNSTDNGANMLRATDVIKLYQSHLLDDFLVNNDMSFHEKAEAFNIFIDREVKKHLSQLQNNNKYAFTIHCAAHTLELCLKDVFKHASTSLDVINRCRDLVKLLRTENIKNVMVVRNLPMAIIDVETRWSSKCYMLERLLKLRSFCEELQNLNEDFVTTDEFWLEVNRIFKALKFVADAMTKLQSSSLTLSDVYGIYTLLSHQLQRNYTSTNDQLSLSLLNALKVRENMILKTVPMYACMYLDPRYQCMLDESEKTAAKGHLIELYNRVKKNASESVIAINEDCSSALELSTISTEQDDDLNMNSLLNSIIQEKCKSMPNLNTGVSAIETILNEFNFPGNKRMNCESNVWDYWRNNTFNRPELYRLAAVVFAVPPTEVGTERNFSILSFVLNKYRNKLESSSLERIMFMKANADLFESLK